MPSTEEILDHHLSSFASADLEATLADYTEDSTLLTAGGAFRGIDQIRAFFTAAYAEFNHPDTRLTLKQRLIDGECAFVVWDGETSKNTYEGASDTFLVRDGRIKVQTFAGKISPKM